MGNSDSFLKIYKVVLVVLRHAANYFNERYKLYILEPIIHLKTLWFALFVYKLKKIDKSNCLKNLHKMTL